MKVKRKIMLWGGESLVLLFLSVIVSVSIGTAKLPISHVWGVLFKQIPFLGDSVTTNWEQSTEQIILKVRFPRVILAILVGAALSLAGAGFQGVLRNP